MNTYSIYLSLLLLTIVTGYPQFLSQQVGNTVSYNISTLWNGTEDTVSNATDKGGNQVTIVLQGMLILYNNHQ